MTGKIDTALIYGSIREGRTCDTVAAWIGERIARRGDFSLDRIDPAEWPIRGDGSAEDTGPAPLRQRLGQADAFVVVVPEYNHGYPAALKALIDAFYEPWQAKPVAFVSYGGLSGGLRAVEQLQQVFVGLHAVPLCDGVSFQRVWDRFDDAGQPREPAGCTAAAKTMLDRLAWWALALREARERRPYGRREAAA